MPEMAGTTEPLELVLRRVEVRDEMAREVVVAFVVVEFKPVKFWRVVEPVSKRFARVESPVKYEAPETERILVLALASEVSPVTARAAPAPDWVMVTKVEAVEVELAASVLRNWVEFKPESFCASKAAGTAPRIFRGDISPSQVGEPDAPPISTPR